MTVWRSAAIPLAPQISLTDWAVLEVALAAGSDECTRHFIGVTTGSRRNTQVSSPVVTFDGNTGRGVTESGRVYQLLKGRHGGHPSVWRTWKRWKEINHIVEDTDVTQQILKEMRST